MENFPTEGLIDEFQVLVFAQLQLLQLAMRRMRARGTGLIVNVTSLRLTIAGSIYARV